MKKFTLKMVACIALATIMILAGILPSMASGTDDLTGWTVGTSNTITGTPTDGWDVTLSGRDLFNKDTFAQYAFDGMASELQITMDMSAMTAGQEFFFQVGNEPGDIYHWAWNGLRATFVFKRSGDNLDIYRHNGGAESTHAVFENFDFTVPHVVEFLKDSSDKYQLALDGDLCLMPWANSTSETVDDYVTTTGAEDDVVVVLFATNVSLKDVKISKKVTATPTPTTAPTSEPTTAPTAEPTTAPTATPGVQNQPTGDSSIALCVVLLVAVGVAFVMIRKKSFAK